MDCGQLRSGGIRSWHGELWNTKLDVRTRPYGSSGILFLTIGKPNYLYRWIRSTRLATIFGLRLLTGSSTVCSWLIGGGLILPDST